MAWRSVWSSSYLQATSLQYFNVLEQCHLRWNSYEVRALHSLRKAWPVLDVCMCPLLSCLDPQRVVFFYTWNTSALGSNAELPCVLGNNCKQVKLIEANLFAITIWKVRHQGTGCKIEFLPKYHISLTVHLCLPESLDDRYVRCISWNVGRLGLIKSKTW